MTLRVGGLEPKLGGHAFELIGDAGRRCRLGRPRGAHALRHHHEVPENRGANRGIALCTSISMEGGRV